MPLMGIWLQHLGAAVRETLEDRFPLSLSFHLIFDGKCVNPKTTVPSLRLNNDRGTTLWLGDRISLAHSLQKSARKLNNAQSQQLAKVVIINSGNFSRQEKTS